MVNVYLTACAVNRVFDGYVHHCLKQIPDMTPVKTPEEADLIFFVWTWRPEWEPDLDMIRRILMAARPVVVFDYLECTNDVEIVLTNPNNGVWNAALQKYAPCATLEPLIKLCFKREYSATITPKTTYPILPTDFMCDTQLNDEPANRDEFEQRPIDLFFVYGYSACERMLLHAELLRRYHHPRQICFTLQQIENALKMGTRNIKALLYVPPALRHPLGDILKYQGMSKLSLSLRGASWKCFRNAEACKNSVMMLQDCRSAFAFPWISGVNCLSLPNLPKPNPSPPYWLDLEAALSRIKSALDSDLHPVYLAGRMNSANYVTKTYIENYWLASLRRICLWP